MPSSASVYPVLSTLSLHDALPISILAAAVLVALVAPTALAQPLVRGRVVDATGKPVADAVVTFVAQFVSLSRNAKTDAKGEFLMVRSEEHTSELQSPCNLVCRLLLLCTPSSPLFPYTTLFRSQFWRPPCSSPSSRRQRSRSRSFAAESLTRPASLSQTRLSHSSRSSCPCREMPRRTPKASS